jgi:ribulose-5-phosphate 4-epimerase/fuculose-1-phosphate aldolase
VIAAGQPSAGAIGLASPVDWALLAVRFNNQEMLVPNELAEARYQVALANRMLANEGVLDAFGHVSLRHPGDPGRYLLSRSRSPGLIEPDDVLEYTLDSAPVKPPTVALYAERVIHGCIYQARPDVMAVVHHHSPAVLPFCIAGVPIKPEEGESLARALGSHAAVLLNNHGATVVGRDLRELVSRAVFMCQNAEYQLKAQLLGKVVTLTPGETRLASTLNALPNVTNRTWEYWTLRLDKADGLPPQPGSARKAAARPQAASAGPKSSNKRSSNKRTSNQTTRGRKSSGRKMPRQTPTGGTRKRRTR